MLTLITSWKTTDDLVKLALESWQANGFKIISVGNGHHPEIWEDVLYAKEVRTEQEYGFEGTAPIIKSMIIEASKHFTSQDMVGLINSDIIIPKGCNQVLDDILAEVGPDVFLTANRYDVKPGHLPQLQESFHTDDWSKVPSKEHPDQSGDIFISSAHNMLEMAENMPEFILGRLAWDNWIHWYFLKRKQLPCFNIRPVFPLFHQDHDSRERDERMMALRKLPAVKHNYDLFFRAGIGKVPSINSWPCPIEPNGNHWNLRRT